MFWPPTSKFPHMHWDYNRPPPNPQWRHPFGPRVTIHGQHQQFNYPRQPFQTGNDNYWCETCDRGFATKDILNKHQRQHQKCNIDGCQFIAHPKVITKHIQMQHSTGLYKKIANLKNPEDIVKWREERRKRYPTKSNIEKRAAELKEKIERGEKMGIQRNRGYLNKPNFDQDNRPGQSIKRKFNSRNENQPNSKFRRTKPLDNKHIKNTQPKAKPPLIGIGDNRLKPFAGILNLQMDSDSENENEFEELSGVIEDEDDSVEPNSENVEKGPENTKPVVCGALSSLICDYGSSEEEDNTEVVRPVTKDVKKLSENNQDSNSLTSNLIQKPNQIKPMSPKTLNRKDNAIHNQPENNINTLNRNDTETMQTVDSVNNAVQNNDFQCNRPEDNSKVNKIVYIAEENGANHVINNDRNEVITDINNMITPGGNIKIKCKVEDEKKSVQETIDDLSDDSGPEEVKAEVRKEDTSVPEQSRNIGKRKPAVKGRMLVNQRHKRRLPSTFLQKLLHKEIQQERNIVLQCIRYIRKNNYFDKKE